MNITPAMPSNVTALTEHAHVHVHWDFETRSTLDLTEVGAWRYATHAMTDVWCCAYCVDDGPVKLWVPGDPVPPEFTEAAQNPNWLVHAFNDQFERLIAQHIMAPRYGWPTIPVERHRCSQAAALALALPADLKKVARALSLTEQKDDDGRKLMLQMAKPRPPRDDEDPSKIYWFDDPERVARQGKYCKQDVEVERALHRRIGSLSAEEQPYWTLDATINDRGVYVDGVLLDGAISITEVAQVAINEELQLITEGEIKTVNQQKIKKWLGAHDCEVADLQKSTLQKALTRTDLPPATRRVIELRLSGAHAAASKLETIRYWRNPDGRVRGMFRYHGASTGRWTSVGLQAHNMKRPLVEDLGAAIEDVATGDFDRMRRRYPQPMSVVGDITRGLFSAAPGYRLLTADFSGVESRGTAWTSGERWKLAQWAKFDHTGAPEDEPYFILGSKFGLSGEQVRTTGKTADIAFSYMGGEGAWKKLAPPGDTSTTVEIKRRQQAWHAAHPNTVRFWHSVNRAAIRAMQHPGCIVPCKRVAFRCEGDFLFMQLPSGREIAYPFPRLRTNNRGDRVVTFMDNEKGKWVEYRQGQGAYGGVWTENAVQAIARDLFAAAMLRLEVAGYHVVLHVHDEICAEVPEGFGSAEEFLRILTTPPDWADGFPIAAKVREGERFCKITPPAAASEKQATNAAAEEDQQAQTECTEEMTLTELGDPTLKTSATSKDELPRLKLANADADDDIATRTVWVTFFPDTLARRSVGGEATLPLLAEKIAAMTDASKAKLPLLKLAKFGNKRSKQNCLRTDANVESVSGIELDYDAEQVTFDAAVAIAKKKQLTALLYTSPSHTDAAPRWRMLLPTSKPLPPGERVKLVARVNGLYGGVFGSESFALSQSYYFGSVNNNPAHRVVVTEGDYIDLRADLDAGAIGKGGKQQTEEARPNEVSGESRLDYLKQFTETIKNPHRPPPEKVIAALAIIANDVDYDTWIAIGQEIKSWDDSDEIGWRIFDDWGATWLGRIKNGQLDTYDTAYARVRWNSFHPTRTNIGALFNRASKISPGWWKGAQQAGQPSPSKPPHFSTDWCDVTQIPQRRWLYGQHYIRGFATASIAPGGVGKSTLAIIDGVCISSGKPLLGVPVDEKVRVWYWNGEEPRNEIARRVHAVCEHYKLDPHFVADGFHFTSGLDEFPIKLVTASRDGIAIDDALLNNIIDFIQANDIGVMIVDPLISSHSVPENDNVAMDAVAKSWGRIAVLANCNVEMVHHTRKPLRGGEENETFSSDARGAGSLMDAVRASRVFSQMTEKEAGEFGVEDRFEYFRVNRGKVNMVRRGASAWYKLVSVAIGNGPPIDPRGGDNVQTVESWVAPDVLADVTTQHAHAIRAKAVGGGYLRDSRAKEGWVGIAVGEVIGLDPEKQRAQIARIHD